MLPYDPVPWLMAQQGTPALRARRLLGLEADGDTEAIAALTRELMSAQCADGSFAGSVMKTAGVLVLLADLRAAAADQVIAAGAEHLLSRLVTQPGYERARTLAPGSLRIPCDLCGFFGPYDQRGSAGAMARGAEEMNHYREYESLLGPKSPVRPVRRSSLDRAGPSSCYSWGLIPLAFLVEALCRAGRARDTRLQPAMNALLGAQRDGGGWCRNLGGHPACTLHALRALGAHPHLRRSAYAARAVGFLWRARPQPRAFAMLHALTGVDVPAADGLRRSVLEALLPRQRRNGTFGRPCEVERVGAVLLAARALGVTPAA